MNSPPFVSLIIPAYASQRTVGDCLAAIERQTFTDMETIIVDSSPDEATANVVRRFPFARLERPGHRMLPQAARNHGAALSRGTLLVFTDPDALPAPDWLERLVAAHHETGAIVVGAIACLGWRWLDTGVHLCKFSTWLPGGPPRLTDMSPTVNLLIARSTFASLGGFPDEVFQGDAVLAWRAIRSGQRLWFEPSALVSHHHLHNVRSFLTERFHRGRDLGLVRAAEWGHSRTRDVLFAAVSLLPVRLLRVIALTAARCWRSGTLLDLARTLPVVLVGHEAWLLGEGLGFASDLLGRASARDDAVAQTSGLVS